MEAGKEFAAIIGRKKTLHVRQRHMQSRKVQQPIKSRRKMVADVLCGKRM